MLFPHTGRGSSLEDDNFRLCRRWIKIHSSSFTSPLDDFMAFHDRISFSACFYPVMTACSHPSNTQPTKYGLLSPSDPSCRKHRPPRSGPKMPFFSLTSDSMHRFGRRLLGSAVSLNWSINPLNHTKKTLICDDYELYGITCSKYRVRPLRLYM